MTGTIQRQLVTAIAILAGTSGLSGGCMMAAPGSQVRKALSGDVLAELPDKLWYEDTGTKDRDVLYARGTNLAFIEKEDGSLTLDLENSDGIQEVWIIETDSGVAGLAMDRAIEASTTQAEVFGKIINDLVGLIGPLLVAPNPAATEPG